MSGVGADGVIRNADGVKVGQLTTHKRGDGATAPAELGNPKEWGVVTFEMSAASDARAASEACVPASGGTWCYGWYAKQVDPVTVWKYCYSNFLHGSRNHSSSVKLGNTTRRSGVVSAGQVAQANHTAGLAYTCSTYYSLN
ncbi:lactococcin 972 family bacteriocin [Streptomyces erythrochromogenes]|uniref:lactococcin 972 family bacteriocin n=1 Tax=Streptomyces erythrochromogenes TaxID=285574 RepID=UPI0036BBC954